MKQMQAEEKATSRLHVLLGLVIAGVLLAVLLEALVQGLPPHYSPLSQPESDLAVGPYGFLMAINFVLRGALTLVFLAALLAVSPAARRSRAGLTLLGVSAVCKVLLAFFATDLTPRPETLHGVIHTLLALVSFLFGALGLLLLAGALRHDPAIRPSPRVLVGLASLTFVMCLVVLGTLAVASQIGVWGLLERLYDGLFYAWMLIVSVGLWSYPVRSAAPERQALGQLRGQRAG